MTRLNESNPDDKMVIDAARWERRPHMKGDQVMTSQRWIPISYSNDDFIR